MTPDLAMVLLVLAMVLLALFSLSDDDDEDGLDNWEDEEYRPNLRPTYGECPECGAPSHEWCREDCTRLDPMDNR